MNRLERGMHCSLCGVRYLKFLARSNLRAYQVVTGAKEKSSEAPVGNRGERLRWRTRWQIGEWSSVGPWEYLFS